MPHVRHTPKRRRAECPVCGRNTAFSQRDSLVFPGGLVMRTFSPHRDPLTGVMCSVGVKHVARGS